MKTKGTDIGKVGGNYPRGAVMPDTSRERPRGEVPPTAALPTMGDQFPWLTAAPSASVPVTQETSTLPIFSPSAGNTDTGVGHSGDLGGAGA